MSSDQHQEDHGPYLHGFSEVEQNRLREQAVFAEHAVYRSIDLSEVSSLLEIGCGVGAQTEILLRRFPNIHVTGIDSNEKQLEAARRNIDTHPLAEGRCEFHQMDAAKLTLDKTFDGAFICWLLEHVPEPTRILSEARRVLNPGGVLYITEVMNHTFFLEPYSPNVWKYWQAFNDYQYEQAGDPFVGAKLGNMLSASGFGDIETNVRQWHWDNRHPVKRKRFIEFWTDLLLSAADQLLQAGCVNEEVIEKTKQELATVQHDPNAVFMYAFMQARAVRV